jgi:outer membrane protein TolC
MIARIFLLLSVSVIPVVAEPVTLRHAVELALRNSTAMAVANADEKRAQQGYFEARNMYIPQVVIGSGLAYSNGFPLSIEGSAPSVLNVNSQSLLYNPAGRDYMKAARTDWGASQKSVEDRRAQVVLDTALAYMELDKLLGTMISLKQQDAAVQKVEQVVRDRVQTGVDSEIELTKARLGAARVRLALANAQGQADVMRMRLSQLTGLPADSIEPVTESIPRFPVVEISPEQAATGSVAFQAATQQAEAKSLRARAERKANYPQVDFAGQYGLLAKYNNYERFFNSFQRHNVTVGVVIRFPFLNFAQRAKAEAAEAEATRAQKEAEAVKQDVASNTLRLQRAVQQLAAARDVAKLEYQLAAAEMQAALARVEAGAATIRDQENARLFENQKYASLLDMMFELDKAQAQLLRSAGDIEKWALGQ